MGFFKKVFGDAVDDLKKSIEDSKNGMLNSLNEVKNDALGTFTQKKSASKTVVDVSATKQTSKPIRKKVEETRRIKNDALGTFTQKKSASKTVVDVSATKQTSKPESHHKIQSGGISIQINELRDFKMKKISDLTKARDEKDRNRTPDNISKWKKVMADLKVIDNALGAGATTLAELKEFAKDDASFIAEIDEFSAKPTPQSVSTKKIEAQPVSETKTEDGSGLFSARLEALINSALQDGVLTDQEKAILKKRAEAEGEDWDEVEMIINARLAERRPTPPPIPPIISVTNENDKVNKSPSVQQPKRSEDSETSNDELENIVESQYLIVNGTVYKEFSKSEINNVIISEVSGLDSSDNISVTIPTCVKKIEDLAFWECSSLTNITFSDNSVTGIGYRAFKECENLETVIFPSSLKKIEYEAFKECVNLKKVDFSRCDKLEEIGYSAFEKCENLETVILPSSLKKIEYDTFEDCDNLTEVDFSRCDKLEVIGSSAFRNCKNLETVILPSSLKKIGSAAFVSCYNLKEIDFSRCSNLEEIISDAFSYCNNIRILDFSKCIKLDLKEWDNHLMKLVLPSGQKTFNKLFLLEQSGYNIDTSKCTNVKVVKDSAFSGMKIKEITILDTVESIGKYAFDECENLKFIVMPAALKEIKPPLGKCMEQLKKVDFSKVTQLKTIPKKLFSYGCHKLKELIIPNGVTEIEDDAFVELDALKRLFLPPTLESIGDLGQRRVSVYCFSPTLEELEPLVYGWDDDDDDEWDEEDLEEDELEELKDNKKKMKINLFVLPQYLDKYIAQRKAERIPEDVLIIQEIPEEYRYYYDN